ncbi:MAG: M50 family metallopeptidase [Ghiorsea sp.]|nr:M50 family metallopeptidase [Ghiorsea sp.]
MDDVVENKWNIGFVILLLSAFILSYIPLLNIPFTWFMTFFHEISHGLSAVLTGGSIEKIVIHIRGSGLCYTTGGYRFVILQAGYMGAVLWGILIYEMADDISHKYTNILAGFFAGLVALFAVLYARDVVTWLILAVLFTMFMSIMKLQKAMVTKLILKFLGLYILLDAVRAPLHLIDGRNYGDGASLSDLTGVPEILWICIWLATGVAGLIYLWRASQKIEVK